MEKSRAIELLEHLAWGRDIERNPYGDALNMAIEALKAQLSREGTTSDLISRQAAIDEIKSVYEWHDTVTMERLIEHLNNLPPIQPERKKGEWSDGYRWQRCSLCKQTGKKSWNFCPNCGADMRGEKDG